VEHCYSPWVFFDESGRKVVMMKHGEYICLCLERKANSVQTWEEHLTEAGAQ